LRQSSERCAGQEPGIDRAGVGSARVAMGGGVGTLHELTAALYFAGAIRPIPVWITGTTALELLAFLRRERWLVESPSPPSRQPPSWTWTTLWRARNAPATPATTPLLTPMIRSLLSRPWRVRVGA
jgi:hypothetical protein